MKVLSSQKAKNAIIMSKYLIITLSNFNYQPLVKRLYGK